MGTKPKRKASAKTFRSAEAKFRKDQERLREEQNAVDLARGFDPRGSRMVAGSGILAKALETMYCVYNPGQRVRFQPPKPRDGAGKALFGRYRGTR